MWLNSSNCRISLRNNKADLLSSAHGNIDSSLTDALEQPKKLCRDWFPSKFSVFAQRNKIRQHWQTSWNCFRIFLPQIFLVFLLFDFGIIFCWFIRWHGKVPSEKKSPVSGIMTHEKRRTCFNRRKEEGIACQDSESHERWTFSERLWGLRNKRNSRPRATGYTIGKTFLFALGQKDPQANLTGKQAKK